MTGPITVQPFILVAAFRYALGRRTYAVQVVAKALVANRDRLPAEDRHLIVREIRQAVAAAQAGGDCDVRDWQRVADVLAVTP